MAVRGLRKRMLVPTSCGGCAGADCSVIWGTILGVVSLFVRMRLEIMHHNCLDADIINNDKLRSVPAVFPFLVPGGDLAEKSVAQDPLDWKRWRFQSTNRYRAESSDLLVCPPFSPRTAGRLHTDAKFLGTEVSWHIWSWHN